MISQGEAHEIMTRVFWECQALRADGQKEYAHDTENALRNFEQTAKDLGISREHVLWIFAKKHLDGVLAHIKGHRSQREDVRGRINDVIVYFCLLRCMVEDNEHNTVTATHGVRAARPEGHHFIPRDLVDGTVPTTKDLQDAQEAREEHRIISTNPGFDALYNSSGPPE